MHVECSSGTVRIACDIQNGAPGGGGGVGRPKLTWKKLTETAGAGASSTSVGPLPGNLEETDGERLP